MTSVANCRALFVAASRFVTCWASRSSKVPLKEKIAQTASPPRKEVDSKSRYR